jgi:malonate-semialdehyde dehydrogenase (acetylating)/methylmalonate-semialdehyde dehydrogenase
MSEVKTLGYFINGKSGKSKAKQFYEIPDPNTGEIIAKAPFCTKDEVNLAVEAEPRFCSVSKGSWKIIWMT